MRVLESHNSLTGLIIENLNIQKNEFLEFDGMWSSSLTDSLTREGNQIINLLIIQSAWQV